ncbi:M48 family metallopeptidase [Sphingobium nicotianae]|uniref:M48 family metallopeptidase n=1 Tax=Sphingobium nicotianae TaxID=2782607 RepID=A0A9X1IQ14_9SPHN|nr:YgjP-like metallopeptidase domain-containing protein [Sphingobium nicotianae]MBT2186286.1 M48 family metallopeptidase [Sphingobium nicotianae]
MSSSRSEHALPLADGDVIALIVQRNARSRRMKLRFDGLADRALLTIPVRASIRAALAWAQEQSGWVEDQRSRAGCPIVLGAGALVPVEGETLRIVTTGLPGRQVRREEGQLLVGGPSDHAGTRTLRWLKARAGTVLAEETMALAARHGLPLRGVSIGDPRARWGSCSSSGDIRYSWRLILAPPHVRLATVAHEVAHLKHMHHGPEFHALVREISPADPDAARAWLRREGRGLHRYTV